MNPFLNQIFNRPWYIDYNSAVDLNWAVKSLLDGKMAFDVDKDFYQPKMVSALSSSSNSGKNLNGVVAVIPISGPLMKDDMFCGPIGMDTIGNYIKEFDRNPDISAIVLKMDSPGGTVSGTANLGKIIASTQKPIIAFIDELAASAAYWLASQCNLVIASDEKAQVGSIGVMLSFADVQPAYEKQGVVFHSIYADQSSEKNKDFEEIRKGEYKKYRESTLNPLADRFISTVKNGRGVSITDESIFKGRVDFADKAIEVGLVDQIASFDETITIALTLAEENKQQILANQITNPISNMKKRPLLEAALQVESLESNDGGSFLNEAQLDALEEKMAGHQTAIDSITAEREQANTALKAAEEKAVQDVTAKETEITALQSAVAVLEGTVDALKKNPAEAGASLNANGEVIDKPTGDEFLAGLNACGDDTQARLAYMKQHGY